MLLVIVALIIPSAMTADFRRIRDHDRMISKMPKISKGEMFQSLNFICEIFNNLVIVNKVLISEYPENISETKHQENAGFEKMSILQTKRTEKKYNL